MVRNAVRQHRVLPAAEPEARIESQSALPQISNVQQQVVRRRAADHCPGRPASSREDSDGDDPRIDCLGEFVFDGAGHSGAAPFRPALDQALQPPTVREFVVIDEHQRVGFDRFGQRPISRGSNTGLRLVNVSDAAVGPARDLGRCPGIGIIVDNKDRGVRIDVRGLSAQCLDRRRQQAGPPIGSHCHHDSRALTRLLCHARPPPFSEEHDRGHI